MPWVMRKLGNRPIIDYVLDLAMSAADRADIVIVIDEASNAVAQYLGDAFCYVVQPEPQGTGAAVLACHEVLHDYDGTLLILYGDTALLQPSSIRGMVTRHRLKNAALTLLTAETEQTLPYGRVLRKRDGQIVEVVEAAQASLAEQEVRELNIGAYVVESTVLWPALEKLVHATTTLPGKHGQAHLPAIVKELALARAPITNYQLLEQDELLGINTLDDLTQAADILQKRQLQPKRIEEENLIHFGTGGWRALIGEGFTLDNVRRLCQALANEVIRTNREDTGIVIGYDRRFLSDVSAQVAAEVFAGNNIFVKFQAGDTPTPLITYATAKETAAYGLMFTASHNPPQWNGLKVFATDGSLPLDEETKVIENEANRLSSQNIVKVPWETAVQSGMVREVDYTNEYVDAVEALIDLQAIRNAGLRVALDAMHGVGQVTLDIILTEARCRIDTIHARHDPLFGGRSPAPDAQQLNQLINIVREGHYDLGLAMDGDADRIAIIDKAGTYISTNQLLLLVYYYLHEIRGERGGITRNLATTHLLDRLAAHFGEPCYEVPVGFKHIAASMKAHNVLLAGESSGGLTIRGHILGKDGIFACALVVEMMAKTGRTIADMLESIYQQIGRLAGREINLPATPEMKIIVQRKLADTTFDRIANCTVDHVSFQDGIKFYLENDSWLLLRFSGTEPLLRIFAEAETDEQVDHLVAWAKAIIA